jgi:hypothetical protein
MGSMDKKNRTKKIQIRAQLNIGLMAAELEEDGTQIRYKKKRKSRYLCFSGNPIALSDPDGDTSIY